MLEVRNLHAGYGRVPVLHDISLTVGPGEVVLVLGGNGAGKSTLLRSIAGFIKPTRGSVLLGGRDITGQPPEINARQGLRLVLDGHRVFPELSVADNIRLGAAVRADGGDFETLAGPVLEFFPILRTKLKSAARDLSGGQQQMLALAQAFVARPAVLLCDEPSLGIAQALIPPILEFLRNWARQGVAVLIVEQQIDVALSVADRALVVERGAITLAGTAEELKQDRRVQDIYLGLTGTS
ncbi:MAG: ABC transporter ATP-binding protein [Betaproteobacteria bacterium]|nr:ABC transporter ATP-binding protein [Betaproteobacteria bacterium]MBK8740017.1 ABC transporter ATP-binding protein [Betaproteobacteria bacterium]